jgi:hypothetical protein
MRCRPRLVALAAAWLLAGGCLQPPADTAPPPVANETTAAGEPAGGLDEVERHAVRVTLRVRNLRVHSCYINNHRCEHLAWRWRQERERERTPQGDDAVVERACWWDLGGRDVIVP